jgi:hypothetical protein
MLASLLLSLALAGPASNEVVLDSPTAPETVESPPPAQATLEAEAVPVPDAEAIPQAESKPRRVSNRPKPPAAEPDLRAVPAPVYIMSAEHLVSLTANDPEVSHMAREIRDRKNTAVAAIVGGGLAGAAIGFIGLSQDVCTDYGYGVRSCVPNMRMVYLGSALASLGLLIGVASQPRADEVISTINTWNERHPDRPIAK